MARGRIRDQIAVTVPRPRDYDDPAVFDVNRDVVRRFLEAAEIADPEPVLHPTGGEP
jgi:hypothetical protein